MQKGSILTPYAFHMVKEKDQSSWHGRKKVCGIHFEMVGNRLPRRGNLSRHIPKVRKMVLSAQDPQWELSFEQPGTGEAKGFCKKQVLGSHCVRLGSLESKPMRGEMGIAHSFALNFLKTQATPSSWDDYWL